MMMSNDGGHRNGGVLLKIWGFYFLWHAHFVKYLMENFKHPLVYGSGDESDHEGNKDVIVW